MEKKRVAAACLLVAASDRVLQLSTCAVPYVRGARYVVTCVLVGEEAVE